MQPMTMGFQNSGKRLQYAVESRECARRVRVLKKLSKRLPLACALAVLIATAFMGMLLSGYGPVAIYTAGGADGIAVRDTRGQPFETDGAHETKLAARGAVSKTPSRGFDAKTDLGAHGTPAAQSAADAGVLAKDRVVTTAPGSALAALWRRVRDGVKRFAKRPHQSDSSITTRSQRKRHKTSGTEREKRARASADEAVDQARPKKRHRAARNAVTMMDIDVKSKKPTARPTQLPTPTPSTPTPTVSPQPTSAPTPVPSAVPTVSPKPSSSPTPAPSAYPTVSPQPTVSPLPTSAPTITPAPTVSPQPTYWPWKRNCNLGPQRNERCTPTADQLHANVKRTEGVIAQSCDHRPDATLEEKNAAFQANVDKLTYVVATGVADSRRVRQNHFPSLYAPCRSIRTCPSRRRTGFLLIFSISYSPTTCAARLHITNSHGPAADRSRSSLRCTTRPSWTTSTS